MQSIVDELEKVVLLTNARKPNLIGIRRAIRNAQRAAVAAEERHQKEINRLQYRLSRSRQSYNPNLNNESADALRPKDTMQELPIQKR